MNVTLPWFDRNINDSCVRVCLFHTVNDIMQWKDKGRKTSWYHLVVKQRETKGSHWTSKSVISRVHFSTNSPNKYSVLLSGPAVRDVREYRESPFSFPCVLYAYVCKVWTCALCKIAWFLAVIMCVYVRVNHSCSVYQKSIKQPDGCCLSHTNTHTSPVTHTLTASM